MSAKNTDKTADKTSTTKTEPVSAETTGRVTQPVNETVGMDSAIGEIRVGKRDELTGGKAAVETTTLAEPGTVDMTHAGDTARSENVPDGGKVKVRLSHFCNEKGCEGGPGDVVAVSGEQARSLLDAGGGTIVRDDPETTDDKLRGKEDRLIRQ